jgi:DNA-binding CsgD family transcriptional regulator
MISGKGDLLAQREAALPVVRAGSASQRRHCAVHIGYFSRTRPIFLPAVPVARAGSWRGVVAARVHLRTSPNGQSKTVIAMA